MSDDHCIHGFFKTSHCPECCSFRLVELEFENAKNRDNMQLLIKYSKCIAKLKAERDRYRVALEFYATLNGPVAKTAKQALSPNPQNEV